MSCTKKNTMKERQRGEKAQQRFLPGKLEKVLDTKPLDHDRHSFLW